MATQITKQMNVTPDKSLMLKMGQKNYKIEQALAELTDNSIDEKLKGKILKIAIRVDPDMDYISHDDNAGGMNETTFKKSAIIGSSSKVDKLGLYGLGLKAACMNLGKEYRVETSKNGIAERYKFEFNEDDWIKDDKLTWDNYPYNLKQTSAEIHGTKIMIRSLKTKNINRRVITRIIDDYAYRYGRLIDSGEVEIEINGEKVYPQILRMEEKSKIDFEFLLDEKDDTTKITGCVGLRWDPITNMVQGSQKGEYGFSTYRNKRLITENDDMKIDGDTFAIRRHPTWASIVGWVDLDCVPVESDKRNFIQEHPSYVKAVKEIRKHVKKIEEHIKKSEKKSTLTDEIIEDTKEKIEVVQTIIKAEDFQDLVSRYTEDDILESIAEEKEADSVEVTKKKVRVDEIEKRRKEVRKRIPKDEKEDDDNDTKPKPKPSDNPHVREPRENFTIDDTKKVIEVEVDKDGSCEIEIADDFKFKHQYVADITGDLLRTWELVDDDTLFVKTNLKYYKNSPGSDYPVFALHDLCECYADFRIGENDDPRNVAILRDEMIKRYYKIIGTLEYVKS